MERALVTLGRRELNQLIAEDQGAELSCHFCRNRYHFSTGELRELVMKASRP
jgi:molecular chaperone Hsp33